METSTELKGSKLLLMGSKAFTEKQLPAEVALRIDEAISRNMTILVGEAKGACRLYQDYLLSKDYRKVVVGHARSMRYNVGDWKTIQYGTNLKERERKMIEDCDSAIVIWTDSSGVIAENLEMLKNLRKSTFLYEHFTRTGEANADWLDPGRTYDPYYTMRECKHNSKRNRRICFANRTILRNPARTWEHWATTKRYAKRGAPGLTRNLV
jgi:hypothetical protein